MRILFSAHGLPEKSVQAGDPYQWQIEENGRRHRRAAEDGPCAELDSTICYRSRVGPLKWLGPYTAEAIEAAAHEGLGVLVSPIAFVSEHVETLVELDRDYAETAEAAGCAPLSARAGAGRGAALHRRPGPHRPDPAVEGGSPGRERLRRPDFARWNGRAAPASPGEGVMNYDLLRGLHILAVVAWMARLLYLPRLFAYSHQEATPGSEMDLTFQTMEKKLLGFIMNPAMIVGLRALGLALIWVGGTQRLGWGFLRMPWMIVKLTGCCLPRRLAPFPGIRRARPSPAARTGGSGTLLAGDQRAAFCRRHPDGPGRHHRGRQGRRPNGLPLDRGPGL